MIATQTAIGNIGEKPTTTLSLKYDSMVNTGGFQYGLNSEGIHRLNTGDTDNGVEFTSEFTLATTDIGSRNPKRCRFIYIGYEVFQLSDPMTISINMDNQGWRNYEVKNLKVGLQRVRVPIGRDGKGRYVTIKISSTKQFRIDSIDGAFYKLSTGNKGY